MPGLYILLFLSLVNCEVLNLRDGSIDGSIGKSKNGRVFRQFYGIPYAEPPIGELRYKAPVPIKPWTGTKSTTSPPPICVQTKHMDITIDSPIIGQEDCLYLNVFTPVNSSTPFGKLPVIVFIHGGAFQFGNGAGNKPDYFMDRDVALVTINYRLGVLGFLNLNNDHISGNFGMKDQSLALQWIKDNISAFGGDPDNITIMGESAGAASVHLHMFSPLSKGLFHRAIMQSGNAFSIWSYDDDVLAETTAMTFIASVGCFYRDMVKVSKCLQRLSADELVASAKSLSNAILQAKPLLFKPSIETKVHHRPFLPQKPSKDTYQTDVPCISGINSGEGGLVIPRFFKNNASLFGLLNKDRKSLLPKILHYNLIFESDDWADITKKISDFYFGSNNIDFSITPKLVQMFTDYMFTCPLIKAVQSSSKPKYVYFYDHRGSFSIQQFMTEVKVELGVCHADEIPLLFRNERLESKWTPRDKFVSQTLLNNWINFATYGDPNGPSPEKLWSPVETEGIEYLHIKSDSISMERNLLKERYELWRSLPLIQ